MVPDNRLAMVPDNHPLYRKEFINVCSLRIPAEEHGFNTASLRILSFSPDFKEVYHPPHIRITSNADVEVTFPQPMTGVLFITPLQDERLATTPAYPRSGKGRPCCSGRADVGH